MSQTALITGASHRIGRFIALKCAQLGYNIALHYYQSHDSALETLSLVQNYNVLCQTFQSNLLDENNLASLIPNVQKQFGNLNLLINNASVFQKTPFLDASFTIFNENFNLNFKAPFFLSSFFAKICKKGHIINILDSKVSQNNINYSSYTLSKKALANLTLMSAKELAPYIRVNGIAPGYILPPEHSSKHYLSQRPQNIPLQCQGHPSQITQALEFFIKNSFVTGQIIFVDGGEHL